MDQKVEKRRRGRPPKAQVGLSETKQALLRVGVATLTEKGFSSTGIDEILRKVDVPKGSFYHHFKNKEVFGKELIAHYAAYFAAKLDRILLDDQVDPLTRIENFVEDAIKGMKRFSYNRGCLVGNLGQEMGALPPSYRELLIEVLREWEDKMAACLKAGVTTGTIQGDLDCGAVAEFFWIGWEGAVLRAKLEKSEMPLRRFAEGFLRGL